MPRRIERQSIPQPIGPVTNVAHVHGLAPTVEESVYVDSSDGSDPYRGQGRGLQDN